MADRPDRRVEIVLDAVPDNRNGERSVRIILRGVFPYGQIPPTLEPVAPGCWRNVYGAFLGALSTGSVFNIDSSVLLPEETP